MTFLVALSKFVICQPGWTAFHHACSLGHTDCVKLLCVGGVSTALGTANRGESGWQLAEQMHHADVCALLARFARKGHPELALEQEAKQG